MITAANVQDSTVFEKLVESIPPVKGKRADLARDPTSCTLIKATTTPATGS